MTNIVDAFMQEFEKIRYEEDIVGVLHEDKVTGVVGFEIVILFYWSYQSKILTDDIFKIASAYDNGEVLSSCESLFDFMKLTIGIELWIRFYKKDFRYLIGNYVRIEGSEYEYNYYVDLNEFNLSSNHLFSFCIDEKIEEKYRKIKKKLDARLQDHNAVCLIAKNN